MIKNEQQAPSTELNQLSLSISFSLGGGAGGVVSELAKPAAGDERQVRETCAQAVGTSEAEPTSDTKTEQVAAIRNPVVDNFEFEIAHAIQCKK